jgi:hypothetical protein
MITAGAALSVPANAQENAAPAGAETAKVDRAAPEIPSPPAGMGQVVFYRPSAMGALVSCRVNEGDKIVNRLPPGKYFIQQTAPGIHEYSVHSEAKDVLRISVEEGETAYARCNINMGFMVGRPNLSTQDRADFEKRGKHLKPQPPFDPNKKNEAKDDTKEASKG